MAYTNALKNSTSKLNLNEIEHTDLFYYTAYANFAKAYDLIKRVPNFKEVDKAAGKNAYSNGMKLYLRFLEQREPISGESLTANHTQQSVESEPSSFANQSTSSSKKR
ncbi:hypothetical protein PU629_13360 [Pullulanibacillus sp. KACC 23026]|uniref:hypothetical protein n=1 Tax=Pullulanibacillus sp. KACC 23026 TaxID=3028315 RepID=UPI0023B0E4B8|nr:hypothetical protein [Pullulanibacillus sp. KACC 23026]WEG11156.1 hypothetical protein PU629_13360 [Pullulanibacillus sp. KACC 23026]